jgi:hypothetical protein
LTVWLGEGAEAVFLEAQRTGSRSTGKLARNAGPKVIVAGVWMPQRGGGYRCRKPGRRRQLEAESAPGIKDHDKVRAFVKAAREATW